MNLLLVRHAIAEDRDEFAKSGKTDDFRPLTNEGRKKFRRVARGLSRLLPRPDVLATSPLTRAKQTARIVGKAMDAPPREIVDALDPDATMDSFIQWMAKHPDADLVVAVGHDPHLSRMITWLLSGSDVQTVTMKKGGACLLSYQSPLTRGLARLEWLATPKQLSDIRK